MRKINLHEVHEEPYWSPKQTMGHYSREISKALGRKPESTDLLERHPFDVEIQRIPPGVAACPYHSHSAQWEFYLVISGGGVVRHDSGEDAIGPGDAFVFKPGEAHQIRGGTGTEDLVVMCIADNPIGESWYYPDSEKYGVVLPKRAFVRAEPLDYWDGEE